MNMITNKYLAIMFFLCGCMSVHAQVIDINKLNKSKWMFKNEIMVDLGNDRDTIRVTFDKKKLYFTEHQVLKHPKTGEIIDRTWGGEYTYYLTDDISYEYNFQNFDHSKVGKVSSGKFICLWHEKGSYMEVWELSEKKDSVAVVTCRIFTRRVYGIHVGRKITLRREQ